MLITPIKTRVFKKSESLADFIVKSIPSSKEKDILFVTKNCPLSENRVIILDQIYKDELVKQESKWSEKTKYRWITLKDGFIMANAGVDKSNANGKYILLPKILSVSRRFVG